LSGLRVGFWKCSLRITLGKSTVHDGVWRYSFRKANIPLEKPVALM
jgi:hypothetical protein